MTTDYPEHPRLNSPRRKDASHLGHDRCTFFIFSRTTCIFCATSSHRSFHRRQNHSAPIYCKTLRMNYDDEIEEEETLSEPKYWNEADQVIERGVVGSFFWRSG